MKSVSSINRRLLLQRAAALASVSVASATLAACEWPTSSRPVFKSYPFTLGIASGDPVGDGFVIWTRLAPDPFDRASVAEESIPIIWEIASDADMKLVVQKGTAIARRGLGHSVHVEVRGLPSGRPYWYRFRIAGGDASPIGRAWTAPEIGSALQRLRFAFASCQHYEQGYFTPYAMMVKDAPDLILHLGDYIYESSWGEQVRRHDGAEPKTLEEYRNRHALYKTDMHLQSAHAQCPWLVTWDDHEVDNDYQGLESEDWQDAAAFVKRRAAAYQAYYEHMPVRHIAFPRENGMQLYQRSTFGDLLEVSMIDNRQYRSPAACRNPERGGGSVVTADCKELFDDARSMLGKDQERWLTGGFRRSKAKWNVIGNGEMFSRLRQKTDEGKEGWWTDDWNGFPNARERVVAAMAKSKLSNPVILTGDIHSFWINDVKENFNDPNSNTVATELVGTSITSAGVPYEQFAAMLPDNPHIKFFESRKRGYMLCEVGVQSLAAELKVVDDVRDPKTKGSTLAKFAIEAGKPGAVKA
ncbi:MAG: alkaline phosphatase D family protein [Alphaproteobacteria bacterium]|nr:alkaline phosphatase D family protein [Alphaproteobacteria bacterium]